MNFITLILTLLLFESCNSDKYLQLKEDPKTGIPSYGIYLEMGESQVSDSIYLMTFADMASRSGKILLVEEVENSKRKILDSVDIAPVKEKEAIACCSDIELNEKQVSGFVTRFKFNDSLTEYSSNIITIWKANLQTKKIEIASPIGIRVKIHH